MDNKIYEVGNIELSVLESSPQQLNIVASGNVTSSGWTNPKLIPYVYITPPLDGIYDFDFVASPPEGPALQVITPIEGQHRLESIPEGFKGVRIHASKNVKVALLGESGTTIVENFVKANLFELTDGCTQVTYSSSSILGQPQLNYRDGNESRNFIGEEIRITDTEIGQLISVTLEVVPDLRTVTFTLVLPTVNVLVQSVGTHVQLLGIKTTTHTTIVGPGPGAEKTYSVLSLQGTAQFVFF